MAGSTNILELALIDGSDFISPMPFNANFEKLDLLGKDYIVDSGVSNDWWYRKWKSGIAECGIQHHFCGNVAVTTPWAGTSGMPVYYGTAWRIGSYPVTFSTPPTCTASVDSPAAGYPWIICSPNSSPSRNGPAIYLVRPGNAETINNVYMSCFMVGKYT